RRDKIDRGFVDNPVCRVVLVEHVAGGPARKRAHAAKLGDAGRSADDGAVELNARGLCERMMRAPRKRLPDADLKRQAEWILTVQPMKLTACNLDTGRIARGETGRRRAQ